MEGDAHPRAGGGADVGAHDHAGAVVEDAVDSDDVVDAAVGEAAVAAADGRADAGGRGGWIRSRWRRPSSHCRLRPCAGWAG